MPRKPKVADEYREVEPEDETELGMDPATNDLALPPHFDSNGDGPHTNGHGRPRVKVNLTKLRQAAAEYATFEEIAAELGVSIATLQRHFADEIEAGWRRAKLSLRRAQFKAALRGNVVMQIWLGKQHLGQIDQSKVKTENTNANFNLNAQVTPEELASARDVIMGRLESIKRRQQHLADPSRRQELGLSAGDSLNEEDQALLAAAQEVEAEVPDPSDVGDEDEYEENLR